MDIMKLVNCLAENDLVLLYRNGHSLAYSIMNNVDMILKTKLVIDKDTKAFYTVTELNINTINLQSTTVRFTFPKLSFL